MMLDLPSVAVTLLIIAALVTAWTFGAQRATRLARRISAHKGNLDRVFFEDAERDPTTSKGEVMRLVMGDHVAGSDR